MTDHKKINETVFDYYYGYLNKDRERMENAFALDVANMQGYIEKEHGNRMLFSMTIRDAINEWTTAGYQPFECSEGIILSLEIFGEIGASVLFDFCGKYLESLQLAKINNEWQIVNKFIVNHKK